MNNKAESEEQRKRREEYEKWDSKMREITKLERKKWNMDNDNKSKIKSTKKINNEENSTKTSAKIKKSFAKGSNVRNNGLHNGRWGMSSGKPVAHEFAKSTSRSFKKLIPVSSIQEEKLLAANFVNGRWGMSAKEIPKGFANELSERSQPLDAPVSHSGIGKQNEGLKGLINSRWGMKVADSSGQESIEDTSSLLRQKIKDQSSVAQSNVHEVPVVPNVFTNGRWGMNVETVPNKFLRHTTRRSQTLENPESVWKQNEERMQLGNRKMENGEMKLGIKAEAVMEPTEKKLLHNDPKGRWGMGVGSEPEEILGEISRPGFVEIPRFYGPAIGHTQGDTDLKKNDHLLKLLMRSDTKEMPETWNAEPTRIFVNIMWVPLYPRYLLDPNIWRLLPNTIIISCDVC